MKVLKFSVLSLLVAIQAHAQQATPATTGSDYTASSFDLSLDPGEIDTRDKLLSVKLSGFKNEDGDNIGSAELRIGKKLTPAITDKYGYRSNWECVDHHYDTGECIKYNPGPAFLLDASLAGRIDYNKDTGEVTRLEARGPRITALGRQFLAYAKKDDRITERDKPFRTSEYRWLNFGAVYKNDKKNKVKSYGGEANVFEGSVHGSGLINGTVPAELCFGAKVASVVVGDTDYQNKDSWYEFKPVSAQACAGIGVGPLGMIRAEAQFDMGLFENNETAPNFVETSATVGLSRKIGPVRTSIGYTYEYTRSSNNGVNRGIRDADTGEIAGIRDPYAKDSEHKHMLTGTVAY